MKKRASLIILAGLVLVLVVVAVLRSAFAGLAPAEEGPVVPHVQLVREGYVNLYLVDTEHGVALIDCGSDPRASGIMSALKARHLGADAVKAIFITHGHRDHLAGCAQFPSAPIYAFEGDRGLIEGRERAHGPLTRWLKAGAGNKLAVALVDGASLEIDGLSVQAFHTPGHTGGSAAFLAHGVLFLGDSATVQADGRLRAAAWAFSDDVATARASVSALEPRLPKDQVKTVACSHSGSAPYSPGLLQVE